MDVSGYWPLECAVCPGVCVCVFVSLCMFDTHWNEGSLRNPIFSGMCMKNQYRFKVWLGEKDGSGIFEGGWYPNANYETWCLVARG